MKGSNVNIESKVNHFQKRYINVLGVLTFDLRYKAPTSVNVTTMELLALKSIALRELRTIRKYHMSGYTLQHTRYNMRMNHIAIGIDMINQALKPTNPINDRHYMQIARIAIANLLS